MTLKLTLPLTVTLIGMLLAAGMFIGRLEQRVTALEQQNQYLHGDLTSWMARKE